MSDSILRKLALPLPAWLLRRILSLTPLDDLWNLAATLGGSLCDRLRAALEVECFCEEGDLRLIPRTGPAIVMANHPHGILDGILLGSLLRGVRSDIKIMGNSIFDFLPGYSEQFIAVDVLRSAKAQNMKALREAIHWLEAGGLLVVFPAGAVSRFHLARMGVTDLPWSCHFVRIAQRTSAKVVPAFISGSNSLWFCLLSVVNERLGSAMLARELTNKTGSRISIGVGQPVAAASLGRFQKTREATEYIRFRTYLLQNRKSAGNAPTGSSSRAPVEPIAAHLLLRDIAQLPTRAALYSTHDYTVYVASAREIPNVLGEIGRLREISFRAAGEGTGCAIDLDQFDDHYQHLFAWHNRQNEIVGAYRLGLSQEIIPARGESGLYTTTLFRFPASWWKDVSPAIELGRSFIRLEHQRNYGALLALWAWHWELSWKYIPSTVTFTDQSASVGDTRLCRSS